MNRQRLQIRFLALAGTAVLGLALTAPAFPPTLHHELYGMVRDEMGDPIGVDNATVTLETATNVQISAPIVPNLGADINYRLSIPMDAGLTPDNYQPTALRPAAPFRMKVTIGAVTYQPIELHGNYANLGKPAESTRMDLTLGEDSDGDGLPDTWEYLLIAMLGGNLTLNDISPEADSDGDGLSNLQEYIAGTYAFDRQDGVSLDIVGYRNGRPQLDFMAIRGRSYTILASSNLTPAAWSAVDFAMPAEPSGSTPLTRYAASDVRVVRAEAIIPTNQTPRIKFFKLQVQ